MELKLFITILIVYFTVISGDPNGGVHPPHGNRGHGHRGHGHDAEVDKDMEKMSEKEMNDAEEFGKLIKELGIKILGKDQENADDISPSEDHNQLNVKALISELFSPSTAAPPASTTRRPVTSTQRLPIKSHWEGWFLSPVDFVMNHNFLEPVYDQDLSGTTQKSVYLTETQYYLDQDELSEEKFGPLAEPFQRRSKDIDIFNSLDIEDQQIDKPVIPVLDTRWANFHLVNSGKRNQRHHVPEHREAEEPMQVVFKSNTQAPFLQKLKEKKRLLESLRLLLPPHALRDEDLLQNQGHDRGLNELVDHGNGEMGDHVHMIPDNHAHMMPGDHAHMIPDDLAHVRPGDHGHAKADDHEHLVGLKDHGHVKDHPILDIELETLHAQHLLDQEKELDLPGDFHDRFRTRFHQEEDESLEPLIEEIYNPIVQNSQDLHQLSHTQQQIHQNSQKKQLVEEPCHGDDAHHHHEEPHHDDIPSRRQPKRADVAPTNTRGKSGLNLGRTNPRNQHAVTPDQDMNERAEKKVPNGRKATRAFMVDKHTQTDTLSQPDTNTRTASAHKTTSADESTTERGGSGTERATSKSAVVQRPNKVTLGRTEDCLGKPPGLYADIEAGCKSFIICHASGRMGSFRCPAGTLFNQIHQVCDWGFKVTCG